MLQMTESAKDYLNSVRPDDGHVTLTVNGGGCAGFTYKWGTSDEYIEKDYVREIEGSFLTIKNPMATSSCGCGESFGV